jgi:uncharacterized membrane protein
MKNKVSIALLLGGLFLLAVSVSLCGIGLSLGFRKLSIISFFSAIGLLVLFHFVRKSGDSETERKLES